VISIKHLELALHCHTHYSLLDGFSTPQENLQACQDTGKTAYTVTEHGNQLSHIYFARLKSKFPDIKIIYGNELYECFDMNIKDKDSKYFHLIALARNENGRKALNHITTLSNLQGFYYKPRISIDKMAEYGKDLVITSACLASKLSREEDYNKCIEYINEYKSIFPYFFLELQPHNAIQQQTYNKKLLRLGKDTNTKCVLGLDVHYATKDDAKYQAYFVQMSGDREAIEEIYEGCYVQNDDEIYSCLSQYLDDDTIDELIQNTNDIISLCDDVQMPFQKPRLPHYKLPQGYNSNYEYLVELTNQGFISRGLDKRKDVEKYKQRLEYELSVIEQMDFSGYFVILWDLLRYLIENGEMVGSGRGCLNGDTNVVTINKGITQLKNLTVGDEVITHDGSKQKVLKTHKYPIQKDEKMINVRTFYGEQKGITLTQDHKVLVGKENTQNLSECYWIQAKDLTTEHYLVLPNYTKYSYNISKNKTLKISDCINIGDFKINDGYIIETKKTIKTQYEHSLKDVSRKLNINDKTIGRYYHNKYYKLTENFYRFKEYILQYFSSIDEWRKYVTSHINEVYTIKNEIILNNDFYWLMGLFISDGWIRSNKTCIGISEQTSKDGNLIPELFHKVFGIEMYPNIDKRRDATSYTTYSKIIYSFFKYLFPDYQYIAQTKYIPDIFKNENIKNKQSLIFGLWLGDGCISDKTTFTSSSERLIKDIQEVLLSLNIPVSITESSYYEKRQEFGQYVHTAWIITVPHKFRHIKYKKNGITRNDCVFLKIRDINEVKNEGYVYDITVENNSSYLTTNGIVHNSGSGSIVNYCLHITDIDPIEYQLPFERFLNPERISYPDIDSDITNREVAVQYLMDKYGQDKVCQVLNFSYITPLVAIKDVASKIFKIPYKIAERISKKFAYPTFEECLKHNPDIYNEYPQYKELFDIAGKFSGKIKTTSIHAGGVGIVDGSVDDYMSLRLGKDGSHVIEVDKREVEEIGIVKYDLLGVKTINIVQETLKLAHIDNFEVNPNNTAFINDKASFETISKGNTKLIFQMESAGMTDLAMQIKPTTLGELSDIIALYRPDSMPFIPNYIEGKKDINNIKYIHPDMAEILDKTYGALIYQEQTMNIVRKFGGRTMGGADIFRKIIGKKLLDLVKPEVDKLRGEIIGNGYSQEVANSVCEMLQDCGGYSFNLSHSISYAVLGLQTAYLKTHYPVEFYTACFNYTDKAKISKYLVDAKENGIEILLPNINKSQAKFSVYNNKVLFGLEMIQGLGEGEVSKILQERNANGEFKSLQDFIQRAKPSEKLIVTLVKAGALPVKNKREFLQKYFNKKYNIPFIYKPVKKAPKIEILQKEWGINTDGLNEQQRTDEYNRLREIKQSVEHQDKMKKQIENVYDKYLVDEELWEFQTLNMFVSNNPFDEIYKHITPVEDIQIGGNGVLVGVIAKVQTKKDKNKNQYAFIEVYTTDGVIEVACWHNEYKQFNEMIKKGQKISLCYSKTEGNLTVKDIMPFDKWIDYYNKELKGNKV